MEVPQTQYMPAPAYCPVQGASYRSSYVWFNIIVAVGLIFAFMLKGTSAAAPIAVIWCLFLAFTLKGQFQASIPLLFLAACYERPILDFGLGIIGTIKLFDIVALAVVVSAWSLPRAQKKKPIHDSIFMLSGIIVLIAVVSSVMVFLFFYGSRFELARLSIYYAAKLVEYALVLNALRSVILQRPDIVRALHFFLFGLTVVALIGVLQGLGIVRIEYYTSITGQSSWTNQSWAISVLGPNHTHLGTYSTLGVFLSIMLLQIRFRLVLLVTAALCLGSLYYSHSATAIAMLVFLVGTSLAFGEFRNKFLLAAVGVAVLISTAVYFSGRFSKGGASAERSRERLSIGGTESGIVYRAFIRPPQLISDAVSKEPRGMIFGYGFRSPRTMLPELPNMGDHNYMAVFADVGIVGLVAYLSCLVAFYKKIASAKKQFPADEFMNVYAHSALLFFWAVVIAMLAQEILWPAHSRGSTFPIFLIFMSLPFFYCESQKSVATRR